MATKGQCFPAAGATQSQAECEAECLTYACVPFKGQCFPDEGGNQTQMACELVCTCVPPHNCRQLNGTTVCTERLPGCNVCAACCMPFPLEQEQCDLCVETSKKPPPGQAPGCGWPHAAAAPPATTN